MQEQAQPFDIIVFHYPCKDGLASGYVGWLAHKLNFWPTPELYPIAHGMQIDLDRLAAKRVLFCDYSPKLDVLNQIELVATKIIVLDHHISAKRDLESKQYAIFDMTKSGVGLTWDYFFPTEQIPLFLRMIQDRDLWTWVVPGSKEFCSGFYTVCSTIDYTNFIELFELFDELYTDPTEIYYYIKLGSVLEKSKDRKIQSIADNSLKRIVMFQGKRVCIVNCTEDYISELGNTIASNPNVDYAVLWRHNAPTNTYNISLRSYGTKADVSIIASSFGGGGHPNAAGFVCQTNPYDLFGDRSHHNL